MSKITEIKTNKDYAVVLFTEFNSYSEIPTNWLLYEETFKDKIACQWPGTKVKNITQKINNREPPAKDWIVHEIQISRYCSSLENARKAAEDSQYYSSAPETFGREHRRRKVTSPVRDVLKKISKKNQVSSSSSDDDNERIKSAPGLPHFPKNSSSEDARRMKRSNQEEFRGNPDESEETEDNGDPNTSRTLTGTKRPKKSYEPKQDKPGATALKSGGVDDEGTVVQVTHNNELEILDAKVDTCIYLLGRLMTEMKDLKQRCASNDNGNFGLDSAISAKVESHLKLDTREGVTAFEERLKTCKKFENEFIRKIKQVGGANGKDFTKRALAIIFSNKFAKENTWEGKITKYKVNTLKVIEICEKVILEKFPTWDKAEFSKAGTNWFRLGNQRAGEQPKQVTKTTTLADKNNPKSNENDA